MSLFLDFPTVLQSCLGTWGETLFRHRKRISLTMSEGKKCPWGAPPPTDQAAPSLHDVMSEQLADDLVSKEETRKHLREKEDEAFARALQASIGPAQASGQAAATAAAAEALPSENSETDCKDDLLIAQMLQV